MKIGDAIKKLRQLKNINQTELSKICGISQTYLSQVENNRKRPNLGILERIGNKLDVPLPVIMFLSIDENDINPEKRELFRILNPSINQYIREIFFGERL